MGGLRSLFGLSKSSEPKQDEEIPSLSTQIIKLPEAWQGNLPCVHGSSDGCSNHNPGQTAVHFDSSLFGPNANKIKPSGNQKSNSEASPKYVIPEIRSNLPRTTDSLAMIPRVHKSVPWSLSFYHVNAAMHDPSAISSLLSCNATTGSNPPLSWTVNALIDPAGKSLLIEYAMAFAVQADLGTWSESTQHGHAVSKEMLIGSGYRDFTPCAHTHLAFTSHRGEGKNQTRYAGFNYTRKVKKEESSKWDEVKEEWRSEVDSIIQPLYCSRCYTDTHLSFSLVGKVTVVSVQVYKDLGEGAHPADPKWLSLAKGVDVQRDESEFGKMKKAFTDVGVSF